MSSHYESVELLKGRVVGLLFAVALAATAYSSRAQAQLLPTRTVPNAQIATDSDRTSSAGEQRVEEGDDSDSLPDAPGDDRVANSISGTVTDTNGGEIAGALVTLSNGRPGAERTLSTDGSGLFSFGDVVPGTYKLTVTSAGLSTWVSQGIVLREGESYDVPRIALRIAVATTNINVVFSQYDIAQEQIKAQEKQRVLGIFPNFFVSYVWNAAPLTSGQKFRLAFRNAIDPEAFVGAAFGAGLEMWQRDYVGYGNGAKGYFTRMGALYGDGFNNSLIAGAILPSLFHQDPRYFYKGTGTTASRVRYALTRSVICRGDNGKWQPNYSNVLGNFASAGLSNAYYPPANRGARLVIDNALIATAANTVGSLFQEFLLKKISRGVQP